MPPVSSLLESVWSRHRDTQNSSDISPKASTQHLLCVSLTDSRVPPCPETSRDHACAWGGLNLLVWNIGLILKQLYEFLFFLASSHHLPSAILLHWWILSQTIESLGYIYAESANFYPGVSLSWMPLTGWGSCLSSLCPRGKIHRWSPFKQDRQTLTF